MEGTSPMNNLNEPSLDAELQAKFARFKTTDEGDKHMTPEEIEADRKGREEIRAAMLEQKYGKVTVKENRPTDTAGKPIMFSEERMAELEKRFGAIQNAEDTVVKPPSPSETIH